MRTLRVLPEAEEELAEAAVWYEAKITGLGVELIAVVDRPYVIFFQFPGDVVEIMAVAQAKRRPRYWANRERR